MTVKLWGLLTNPAEILLALEEEGLLE